MIAPETSGETATTNRAKEWLIEIEALVTAQPSGDDLDGCDHFLRLLHVQMSYAANLIGSLETCFNVRFIEILKDADYANGFKSVKHSSTLSLAFVSGIIPTIAAPLERLRIQMKVCEVISNDYRTLISAFKKEKDFIPQNTSPDARNPAISNRAN